MKIKKLNAKGVAHHIFVPLLAISLIAGAGAYIVTKSSANTIYSNGAIYTGYLFVNQDGTKKTSSNYHYNPSRPDNPYVYDLAFSPDGKQVSYWTKTSSFVNSSLYIANSDGSNERMIYTTPAGMGVAGVASWSKDGKLLTFTQFQSDAPDQQELATLKVDGSGYQTVPTYVDESRDEHYVVLPTFYSDNETIGYMATSSDSDYANKFCKTNIITENSSCVDIKLRSGFDIRDDSLSLSADSKIALVVTSSSDRSSCDSEGSCAYAENIHKVDTASGAVTDVTRFKPQLAGSEVTSAIWSPDNNKIAYALARPGESATKTYVANPDGSDAKLISEEGGKIAWQPYLKGTSQPPLPYSQSDISCRIDSRLADLVAGKPANIKVTFINNAPTPVTTSPYLQQALSKGSSPKEFPITTIPPTNINSGASTQITVPTIVIPYASIGSEILILGIMQKFDTYNSIACESYFNLPKPPVTISGASSRTVAYNKPMKVSGTAAPKKEVRLYVDGKYSISAFADSTGKFSISYTPKSDVKFYVQVFGKNSSTHTAKVRATVNGATVRSVKKRANVTISGTYKPNTVLKVHMRKSGDPAGKYPRVISVKTNAKGAYSFTFKADTKKVFYVQAPNATKTPLYTIKLK